jgi:hypothetical protein
MGPARTPDLGRSKKPSKVLAMNELAVLGLLSHGFNEGLMRKNPSKWFVKSLRAAPTVVDVGSRQGVIDMPVIKARAKKEQLRATA